MKTLSLLNAILAAGVLTMSAQQNMDKVQIKATHVAGTVYMLEGAGGNIGVSVGEDGILIVDDQFAPLAEKIQAAVRSLNPGKIKYVLNTHWHGDHTGGNAYFGRQADIIAQDQVLTRLAGRADIERSALPMITFQDTVSVHINGEKVMMQHIGPGHTDGDSTVAFTSSNVVHMGDLFFNGRFPFIDLGSGGDVRGYLQNVETALNRIPDGAKIIPGHGALADKEDLRSFYEMLKTVTDQIQSAIDSGKSLEQVKAAGVPPEYKSWGEGFINESRFLEICYNGMKGN